MVSAGGILIAGIGGVFREKVWDGTLLAARGDINSPKDFARTCGAGNRWRGGTPLKHRSSIFPSMVEKYRGMRADVLVTHEAPDLHKHGNAALTRLAADLGVRAAFHGHHHQRIVYPGGVWQGVSLDGIVALDTATFEVSEIDPGRVSTKDALGVWS